MARDLRHDMRSRAEAVDAEALARTSELQRAVADQPGAEQRRGFGVAIAVRNRKHVACVGHGVLGIAAVDLVAGEARMVAEIFGALAAIGACAVGIAEPRHADAHPRSEALDAVAQGLDAPDDLVPEHERKLRLRELAVEDMQVGAAHPARRDLDQDLVRARSGHR